MSIRKDTNPRPLELPPEMQDILMRNGIRGHLAGSSEGFMLIVQGHDSPVLSYPISQKQLDAFMQWGTNYSNKRCYNTFASIVAADFDMPKDFVHARNANGRVAMGLHGYRIGTGEYGRTGIPFHRPGFPWGPGFLGWTPRQQWGFHLRRIGGDLYYPGAPMVPNRPDGRMKPGELQSGGYGFYYKGHSTAPVAEKDMLKELESVIEPVQNRERSTEPAKPYKELITSDVYFSNEKWLECLGSHGIILDAENRMLTIQSASVAADFRYDLSEEEVKILTDNSLKDNSIDKRLGIINSIIRNDFAGEISKDTLNRTEHIDLALQPSVAEDLTYKLQATEQITQQQEYEISCEPSLRDSLPKGGVIMDGNDLAYMDANKGWFREGKHGREVTVGDIRVEPVESEGKYRMTAVIDGEVVSHEITQKQYDKFMAIDDYHRMKLFSKIFGEVDMKSRDQTPIGAKIGAALLAGAVVAGELGRGLRGHPGPDIFMSRHGGPPPVAYYKPGVDTPMDVAARNFEAAVNAEITRNDHLGHGM